MKPLNHLDRKQIFTRFLMASISVLGLFGYSIYSYVFMNDEISSIDIAYSEEIRSMEKFINKANTQVDAFRESDNNTDRSSYRMELNSIIRENTSNFDKHKNIFLSVSEKYKDLMRATEKIVVRDAIGEDACEDQVEALELEIEELELQIEDYLTKGEIVSKAKIGIERITETLKEMNDELNEKDWCKGPGDGREEVKDELKRRIQEINKDILYRLEDL